MLNLVLGNTKATVAFRGVENFNWCDMYWRCIKHNIVVTYIIFQNDEIHKKNSR